MSEPQKIGIIGGGISGLALGYYLAKLNFKVAIFEKDKDLGGLLGSFDLDESGKIKLEKNYHHNFTDEKHILELISDLGLGGELEWRRAPMSVFIHKQFYSFITPWDLLKFPHLNIISKIRLGLVTAFLKIRKNFGERQDAPAAAWLKKYAGQQVWQTIWQPLFEGKFGQFYQEISLSWFATRVKQRGHSANKAGEVLGYPKNGYQRIIDRLETAILSAGGRIYKGIGAKKIEQMAGGRFKLLTESGEEEFDVIVSTIAPPLLAGLLPAELAQFKERLAAIKYIGNISVIFELKEPLTKYYWTNILAGGFSFRGIMEQTNFIPRERYAGKNLCYLSHYTATDSPYFNLGKEELISLYVSDLKKINPAVADLIVKHWIFKNEYAQPIITPDYPRNLLTLKTPVDNLYFLSMAHIFPGDRGVDMAIGDCQKLARLISTEHQTFLSAQKWNEMMYEKYPTKRTYENKRWLVRFIERRRIKAVIKLAAIKPTDRIIEIGCEAGYLLNRLPDAKEIVGLDIAEKALADARRNLKSDKVKLICADGSDVPFADNYFDKVICSEMLEHAANPQKVIAEIYRLVRAGGEAIITVPYEKVLTDFKKLFRKLKLFNFLFPNIENKTSAWHIQNFNKPRILGLLKTYFEISKFKWVPFWPIGPIMAIKCRPKKFKN
ncbi:MAG: FAD-dependent oxidoreductase [bacterium]